MATMLLPVAGVPEIMPGDDLAGILADAIDASRIGVKTDDVVVVCQKVVSKSEGRVVDLETVEPSKRARVFAESCDKDPRVVEVALRESSEILRMDNGHLITRTGPGWICANSGIDRSNQSRADRLSLLPADADASATVLRDTLCDRFGLRLAVVVTDTWGRPWRLGQLDFAIGCAGLDVLLDESGRTDRNGRALEHTQIAVADQLAAAAGLLMGKSEGVPAVIVRGAPYRPGDGHARDLIRPPADDLFK